MKSIGIDVKNKNVGEITIGLAKRNTKRYGCCRQELPDINYYHIEKRGKYHIKVYDKFQKHTIEISKWVMYLIVDKHFIDKDCRKISQENLDAESVMECCNY